MVSTSLDPDFIADPRVRRACTRIWAAFPGPLERPIVLALRAGRPHYVAPDGTTVPVKATANGGADAAAGVLPARLVDELLTLGRVAGADVRVTIESGWFGRLLVQRDGRLILTATVDRERPRPRPRARR